MNRNFFNRECQACGGAARQAASFIAIAAILFIQSCASVPQASRVPLHVYQDDKTVVSLWDGECQEEVAALIARAAPAYRDRFRNLTSTFTLQSGARQDFAGCWMELTDAETRGQGGAFSMLFEDGDQHVVPKAMFKARAGTI